MITRVERLAKTLLLALLLATGAFWEASVAQITQGGGFSVSPVRIDFAKDEQTATVEVFNPGPDPLTIQIRLFGWTTKGEEEVFAASKDIGFSPAIFKVQPKMRQTVRLFQLVKATPVEGSYRLFVDEIPVASTQSGVQMPVRMILPVWVAPAVEGTAGPALKWDAAYNTTQHQVTLTVTNTGPIHDKILDLSCMVDGVKHSVRPGLAGYALAGQSRSWSFPLPNAPKDLTVEARNEGKPITAHILLTP